MQPGTGIPEPAQQPACCRGNCRKPAAVIVPRHLLVDAENDPRWRVCQACYTWIRRHFHLCNMVHKKCWHKPSANCRAILQSFADANVRFTHSAANESWPPHRSGADDDVGSDDGRNSSRHGRGARARTASHASAAAAGGRAGESGAVHEPVLPSYPTAPRAAAVSAAVITPAGYARGHPNADPVGAGGGASSAGRAVSESAHSTTSRRHKHRGNDFHPSLEALKRLNLVSVHLHHKHKPQPHDVGSGHARDTAAAISSGSRARPLSGLETLMMATDALDRASPSDAQRRSLTAPRDTSEHATDGRNGKRARPHRQSDDTLACRPIKKRFRGAQQGDVAPRQCHQPSSVAPTPVPAARLGYPAASSRAAPQPSAFEAHQPSAFATPALSGRSRKQIRVRGVGAGLPGADTGVNLAVVVPWSSEVYGERLLPVFVTYMTAVLSRLPLARFVIMIMEAAPQRSTPSSAAGVSLTPIGTSPKGTVATRGAGVEFNRGQLMNLGFLQAADAGFTSFVFQEPYLVPAPSLYQWYMQQPDSPCHIGAAPHEPCSLVLRNRASGMRVSPPTTQGKAYKQLLPSPTRFKDVAPSGLDGAVCIAAKHFWLANGYPNNMWHACGGEGAALAQRLAEHGDIRIQTPESGVFQDYSRSAVAGETARAHMGSGSAESGVRAARAVLRSHADTFRVNGLNELLGHGATDRSVWVSRTVMSDHCVRHKVRLPVTTGRPQPVLSVAVPTPVAVVHPSYGPRPVLSVRQPRPMARASGACNSARLGEPVLPTHVALRDAQSQCGSPFHTPGGDVPDSRTGSHTSDVGVGTSPVHVTDSGVSVHPRYVHRSVSTRVPVPQAVSVWPPATAAPRRTKYASAGHSSPATTPYRGLNTARAFAAGCYDQDIDEDISMQPLATTSRDARDCDREDVPPTLALSRSQSAPAHHRVERGAPGGASCASDFAMRGRSEVRCGVHARGTRPWAMPGASSRRS